MKIGLDIDEVISDLQNWYLQHFYPDNTTPPTEWGDKRFKDFDSKVSSQPNFWKMLPPKVHSWNLQFEVSAFISHRPPSAQADTEWWIRNVAMFPSTIPVFCIGRGNSKLKVAKRLELTHFIDDNVEVFEEMNKGGIKCLLYAMSHNSNLNIADKITDLNHIVNYSYAN